MSPYLFLLVTEVLSLLMQQASDTKKIEGVQMNHNGPVISYLFFVNDTLIFLKAEKENCINLVHLIDDYCSVSGEQVNLHKSNVLFGGNIMAILAEELTNILGMDKVEDLGVYLGVPAIWGRSKRCGLAYVKGRLLGKIQGWKKSTLSLAGRDVLIKAVAQAIPTYPMNLFKFLMTFCKELDVMIADFW